MIRPIILIFISITSSLAFTSCTNALPDVTPSALTRAQRFDPQLTEVDLTAGRGLYGTRCTRCHLAQPPHGRSLSRWQRDLAAMRDRAFLNEVQARQVLGYLAAFAAPEPPQPLPEAASESGK